MSFTEDELQRYARHIVLKDMGGVGQQKLKSASVLVVGGGGLGAPVIQYLAAAGIGRLGVIDKDVVSLSNLQRQIIHRSQDIDQPKVASAERFVSELNSNVEFVGHADWLNEDNAREIIGQYDLVCDGSDNFDTRYLTADICEEMGVTLVTAAVGQFDGSITVLKPHEKGEDGKLLPRYRDLFPEKPAEGSLPTCAEAGILGALTGIVGSLQAMEAIKELSGMGSSLVGRLLLIDAMSMRFSEIRYKRYD